MTLLRVLLVVGVVVLLGAVSGVQNRTATSAGVARSAGSSGSGVQNRTAACNHSRRPVRVRLSRRRWPHVADHVADVDQDFPRVLHLDRRHADANREESLRGVRTRPGYDRDEYPPAVSREGGEGADVRLVRSSENRSAGAYMGARLRRYCDGQAFRLVVRR